MRVAFHKVDGRLCAWVAAPPKRKRFQGTTMASGRDLPHDLAQFVVEDVLGLQHGFWDCLPTARPSRASSDAVVRSRAGNSSRWSIHRICRVTRSRHQSGSLGSPRRKNPWSTLYYMSWEPYGEIGT
jgi:hypothetical protein